MHFDYQALKAKCYKCYNVTLFLVAENFTLFFSFSNAFNSAKIFVNYRKNTIMKPITKKKCQGKCKIVNGHLINTCAVCGNDDY